MKYKFSYTNSNVYGKYKFTYNCFGEIYKEKLYTDLMYQQNDIIKANNYINFIHEQNKSTIDNILNLLTQQHNSFLEDIIKNIELPYKNFFVNKSFLFETETKINVILTNYLLERLNLNSLKEIEFIYSLFDNKNIHISKSQNMIDINIKYLIESKNFEVSNNTKSIFNINEFVSETYIKKLEIFKTLSYNINDNEIEINNNILSIKKLVEIYKLNNILASENPKNINILYNYFLDRVFKKNHIINNILTEKSNKNSTIYNNKLLSSVDVEIDIVSELILSLIKEILLSNDIILAPKRKPILKYNDIITEFETKEFIFSNINLYDKKIFENYIDTNTLKFIKDIYQKNSISDFKHISFLKDRYSGIGENIVYKFLKEIKESNILNQRKKLEKEFKDLKVFNIFEYLEKINKDSNSLYHTKYLTKAFKDTNIIYIIKYLNKVFKDIDVYYIEHNLKRINIKDNLIELIYLFANKNSIRDTLIDKTKKFANKDFLKEIYIYNKYNNLSINQTKDLILIFDIYFNRNISIDISIENFKSLSKEYKNIDILKSLFLDSKQKQIYLNNEHELKLWKRFWFLYAEDETDKKILPSVDYPYEEQPIEFEGFEDLIPVNWNVVYPEKFWLGISHHPIQNGKYLATKEIPLAINIMIEMVNILLLMWYKFYPAFWGWTGTQAVLGITNSVFEWITLETSIEQQEDKNSRIHYERCYRWLRWEAEKVSLLARNDMELRGNYYVGILLEEMINYMLDHHFDIMPIFEDVNKMDEWRTLFERDLQNDIPFILDKVKGIRHKLIVGKEKKDNV